MGYRNNNPYFTVARFDSVCAETGRKITKGERIAYYPRDKKAFCDESKQAGELRGQEFSSAYGMADANW